MTDKESAAFENDTTTIQMALQDFSEAGLSEELLRTCFDATLALYRIYERTAALESDLATSEAARESAEEVVKGLCALNDESDLGEFSKGVGLLMVRYLAHTEENQ